MFENLSEAQKQQFKAQLGSVVRTLLQLIAGGLLTAAGVRFAAVVEPILKPLIAFIGKQPAEVIGGGVISVGGLVWGLRKHLKQNRKIEVARQVPDIIKRKDLEEAIDKTKDVKEAVKELSR